MKTLGALLLLVAVGLLGVLLAPEPSEPAGVDPKAPEEGSEEAGEARLQAPLEPAPLRDEPPAAPAPRTPISPASGASAAASLEPARVVARLVDEGGSPLGQGVLAVREEGISAVAGPDGEVRAELPCETEEPERRKLQAAAPGRASRSLEVHTRSGETTWLGAVELAPGATLEGRVLAASGEPLAGAEVTPLRPSRAREGVDGRPLRPYGTPLLPPSRTDGEGAFRLPGLPLGNVQLWAEIETHHGELSGVLTLEAGLRPPPVTLRLDPRDPSTSLGGRVRDPSGAPREGAVVILLQPTPRGSRYRRGQGETDSEGRFHFFGVAPEGEPLELRALDGADAFDPSLDLPVELGQGDLELQLREPAPEVALRLQDPRGAPVAGARLLARGQRLGASYWQSREATSDEAGIARFRPPRGRFRLEVTAGGYEKLGATGLDSDTLPTPWILTLEPQTRLEGRVSSAGRPIEGAKVGLHPAYELGQRHFSRDVTPLDRPFDLLCDSRVANEDRTDANGSFALGHLGEGHAYLRVEATGFPPLLHGPLDLGAAHDPIELSLRRPGALAGRVIPAPGVDPTGLVVGVSGGDSWATTRTVGPDGRYRFEDLPPGPVQLRRCLPGRAARQRLLKAGHRRPLLGEAEWDGSVPEDGTLTLDLDLRREGACRLRVVLPELYGRVGWGAGLRAIDAGGSASGPTLARGEAEASKGERPTLDLALSRPGPYLLEFASTSLHMNVRGTVTVELGPGQNDLDLDFPLATVAVTPPDEMVAEADLRGAFVFHHWKGPGDLELWTLVYSHAAMTSSQIYLVSSPDAGDPPGSHRVPVGEARFVTYSNGWYDPDGEKELGFGDVTAGTHTRVDLR